MRFLFYTHSLVSDWNHGNAHFLRGVLRDLIRRGHEAVALEPEDAWSRRNLLQEQGPDALRDFRNAFPDLRSVSYDDDFVHEEMLSDADVVVVHEWTEPSLVARIARARRQGGAFTLLFHDTHHRAVSADSGISNLDLEGYDGVLAFGETLRQRYQDAGWGKQVFTWHEAADDSVFFPRSEVRKTGDLIWIGNWSDDEHSEEFFEFFMRPARDLALKATVRGIRYPDDAVDVLSDAGISYQGWIANAEVPIAFAENRATVHIPRRAHVESLPGIPTIRVFQALACGIPLISAPWDDAENLFRTGEDYLVARNGSEMTAHLCDVLNDPDFAASVAQSGLETIRARHTCRHRVDELLQIVAELGSTEAAQTINPTESVQ